MERERATEQQQQFFKSPEVPTWTEKELNLGTVDDYTLSLLDSLGVMLASSPKGLHVVDLLSSCCLASFQKGI